MSIICSSGRQPKDIKLLYLDFSKDIKYFSKNVYAMFKCDLSRYQIRPTTLLITVKSHYII